jgi:hypothetical protein
MATDRAIFSPFCQRHFLGYLLGIPKLLCMETKIAARKDRATEPRYFSL